MTKEQIIDVSTYNGKINWKKAKASGVDGAIIKIIRKDLKEDSQFYNNYKGCHKQKLPWGVYNYSYATTESKARSDMRLVCSTLDRLDKTYFKLGVWFDIEDDVQARLSKDKIASIINAAQKVVEEHGYPFGVYTGMAYYAAHIDPKKVKCKNWWIARYYKGYEPMKITEMPNADYKPRVPDNLFGWQYTSSGVIASGVSTGNGGKFDFNLQYRNVAVHKPVTYPGAFPSLPAAKPWYCVGDGYKRRLKRKTDIKRIQKLLNWLGDYGLQTDGKYGEKTASAVKLFQRKSGIPVNGKFGKKCLKAAKLVKK